MDLILHGLNKGQLAAVTSPADVLQILAPPGSGKTKTLTSRVAYLIRHHNYKPWNILCLTFTIKSSREMRERLAKLIGNGTEAKLVLGTFHSVCRRYLVSYGHLIGIPKDFGIADSSDTLSIIKRITKRRRYNIDPKAAQSRISSLKSRGVNFSDFLGEAAKKKNVDQQDFAQIFEEYEDRLTQANLLDYDDLLLRCSDLLRQHPMCVSNVEAVLIDEFQDTNIVQFDLMRLFAAHQKRVTTVGDPDQSIYGWRSAEVKNLGRMQTQYPENLVIHLQDNYRSSGAILLAAQELIEQDASRPAKTLLPTHCPGTSPVLRRLPSSDAEALWIVSEIERTIGMTGGMLKHPDFAILLRSAALSRHIESAMGKAGIPYRMVGGQRFFDRVEVKILLDYLRVISQPTNNDAVARILNIPARGLGVTTVKALLEEAESKSLTMWSFVQDAVRGNLRVLTKLNKPAEQGLGIFINIILTARRKLKDPLKPMSPQLLLQHIIAKLNFRKYLERTYENDHENRWANVEELIAQAADHPIPDVLVAADVAEADNMSLPAVEGVAQLKGDASEDMLSTFLANVALATELQKNEETEESPSPSQVTISTIHAAKGLEWPVVFIPAAYDGSIPHSRAEDTDEERRLLYVAMTRAQALLYLSCPMKNSQREDSILSQFLDPKSVGRYLVKAGAKLDSGLVSDIARILRRPCPSEAMIHKESLALQTKEDDLWPLDGQAPPKMVRSRWDNTEGYISPDNCRHAVQWSKPRSVTDKQATYPSDRAKTLMSPETSIGNTTMESSSSFSIYSFGGFTSAANQLHQGEREQRKVDNTDQVTAHRHMAAVENRAKATSRKRKTPDEAYGSLTSLWGFASQPAATNLPPEGPHAKRMAEPVLNDLQSEMAPVLPVGNKPSSLMHAQPVSKAIGNEQGLPRIPLATMPEKLAHHRFQPSMNISRPQFQKSEQDQPDGHYMFLSSSPTAAEKTDRGQPQTLEAGPRDAVGMRDMGDRRAEAASGDLRPAVTTHTTSMAQVRAANALKKTLGVRRSMNGWHTRGIQGFSVPRKMQK